MSHGHPDYGISAPSSYAFPIVSWEDYFIRQGLIKTLDGKGDIIFFDSFEQGLSKWYNIGDTGSLQDSLLHARGGNFSLELNANISTGAILPVYAPSKFGAEFNFTYPAPQGLPIFGLQYYTTTRKSDFQIRYYPTTKKLQYYKPPGEWENFADVNWEVQLLYYFHPVKLVIDAKREEYVKFIARDIEYDLSGLKPAYDIAAFRPALRVSYDWNWLTGPHYPSYLDDVIVTKNEP